MSKRFLSVILTLVMTLGLLPCQAAEVTPTPAEEVYALSPDTGFLDVKDGDWFAPYVDVCVKAGLMNGVGDGLFAPDKTLSSVECAVLALRLHQIGQGGDGTLPAAPKDWGRGVFTFPDGTQIQRYWDNETVWKWTILSRGGSAHLTFKPADEEQAAAYRAMDYQSATLTINGVTVQGSLHLNGGSTLYFWTKEPEQYQRMEPFTRPQLFPGPDKWYRDAWYYAHQNDLMDLVDNIWDYSDNELRDSFAQRVAAVVDLPELNQITALPDAYGSEVRELYRAGVLTGSDEYGRFRPYSTLTRGEAAAILARVLKPELRRSFSLKSLESYEPYTLTELMDDPERPYGPSRPTLSEHLLSPDNATLLRLDGTTFPIPEGWDLVGIQGREAGLTHLGDWACAVMDEQGQLREATSEEVHGFYWTQDDRFRLYNGYGSGGIGAPAYAFFNEDAQQVTPCFDWRGIVSDQGIGFVGLEGKIYRIEFAR